MSRRRDDIDFQDPQTAFAPGKTISNGSPGMRAGPEVETKSLWVPMETRPDCSEVVHGFGVSAILITDNRTFLQDYIVFKKGSIHRVAACPT